MGAWAEGSRGPPSLRCAGLCRHRTKPRRTKRSLKPPQMLQASPWPGLTLAAGTSGPGGTADSVGRSISYTKTIISIK